ncbi:hypothetical protein BDK51DRAFT_44861 [Blyttiomyces helicus]|uniref:Uncharacterized protein n=1 Tax=Blyttiomyces helicus TaxID=388810 RepID=A0A4P9WNZ3_9FUNG|nr:hypothetical protein BDK51DRAFT_44861 [Blyttiomyces helicus]|eukprot:RKO93428.1 hypothetical protein BDK51DRAFT_44861 [Blyttiomyces helicus]
MQEVQPTSDEETASSGGVQIDSLDPREPIGSRATDKEEAGPGAPSREIQVREARAAWFSSYHFYACDSSASVVYHSSVVLRRGVVAFIAATRRAHVADKLEVPIWAGALAIAAFTYCPQLMALKMEFTGKSDGVAHVADDAAELEGLAPTIARLRYLHLGESLLDRSVSPAIEYWCPFNPAAYQALNNTSSATDDSITTTGAAPMAEELPLLKTLILQKSPNNLFLALLMAARAPLRRLACTNYFSKDIFQTLMAHFPTIRELTLSNVCSSAVADVLEILNPHQLLIHLYLQSTSLDHKPSGIFTKFLISNCSHLRVLDIGHLIIKPNALAIFSATCRNFRLTLDPDQKLSSNDVELLAEPKKECPSLHHIMLPLPKVTTGKRAANWDYQLRRLRLSLFHRADALGQFDVGISYAELDLESSNFETFA